MKWPTDNGPIGTLVNLGIIRDLEQVEEWAKSQEFDHLPDGRRRYYARAPFLRSNAIRCLAALSLEGYSVGTYATKGKELDIRIVESPR